MADLKARLDEVIDRALAEKRLVGGVITVAKDGEVVYERAAGYADREAGRAMTSDAILRYASLSKPIVSAAALALLDEGKLALADPVTKFLPDFRPKLADGSEPVITIKHLLTHTSGLTYPFFEPPESAYFDLEIGDGLNGVRAPMAENLTRIARWPLYFPPGSAWTYGVSTDVLGAAMAQAAGESLPDIVRRTVTGPLGMKDTGFAVTDRGRLATAYADAQPEPVIMSEGHAIPFGASPIVYTPSRALDETAFPSGGAGMVGTAPEFLRFLETIRKGGAPILKAETGKLLLANQIDVPVAILGPGYGFSLGGAILLDPSATALPTPQPKGVWQWGGVYGGSWFVDPANRLSVLTLSNTAIEGMAGATTTEVRDAVYG